MFFPSAFGTCILTSAWATLLRCSRLHIGKRYTNLGSFRGTNLTVSALLQWLPHLLSVMCWQLCPSLRPCAQLHTGDQPQLLLLCLCIPISLSQECPCQLPPWPTPTHLSRWSSDERFLGVFSDLQGQFLVLYPPISPCHKFSISFHLTHTHAVITVPGTILSAL